MDIKELLYKRALITEKERYSNNKITEVKFLELSPSGNWVKIINMHGTKYWKPVTEISLIEVLIELKSAR